LAALARGWRALALRKGNSADRPLRCAENLHKLKGLEYLNLALNNIQLARRAHALRALAFKARSPLKLGHHNRLRTWRAARRWPSWT
jgi:hypothetical protein